MKNSSRTHSAVIRLGLIAMITFVLVPIVVAGQERLEWELAIPFRFLREPAIMDEITKVYESLDQQTAEELERALQERHEASVKQRRIDDLRECLAQGKTAEDCEEMTHYPFSGWWSKLAFGNYDATCWNAKTLRFRDEERCRPNATPNTYRIRVWLPEDSNIPADLRWTENGSPTAGYPCSLQRPSICREFEINGKETSEISLLDSGGRAFGISGPIQVKPTLIVGLGDSYASGEGNPDIPAQFMLSRNRSDVDFAYFWKWRRLVRKDDHDPSFQPLNGRSSEVAWLDRRCHRSMYSYQFKTALLYALKHPREAVTFVSYSCSGGTTNNIINEVQKPNEKMAGVDNDIRPQLEVLRKVIGNRPIDYLLLSTGGNDLSFAKYVTNIVTSGRTRILLKVLGQALRAGEKRTRRSLEQVKGNYARLHWTIFDPKSGISIKTCHNGQPCPERIILTPYPSMFTNEKGDRCEINRDEFTLPFNKDEGRVDRMVEVRDKLANELAEFQSKISPGWTLATSHRDKYLHHGFCAQNGVKDVPLEINENFMMLRRRNHQWRALDWRDNDERAFHLYDPREYRPYDPDRARWIRLPIDSKMTSDQQDRFLNWFSYDFLFMDDRSSVMHPTGYAHSVHADANLSAISSLNLQ